MDSQKPNINELISGLLDGHLSVDESKRLAEESSQNPQIERDTEVLGSLRSSLLRGRPVGKLGDHFAVRVMESAKLRAASMGDEAPEWIERPRNGSIPVPFNPSELKRRWVVPAVSVLATCVIAFLFTKLSLMYNESLERERLEQVAEFNQKQSEENLLSVFDASTQDRDKSSIPINDEEANTKSSLVDNLLAGLDKQSGSGSIRETSPLPSSDQTTNLPNAQQDGRSMDGAVASNSSPKGPDGTKEFLKDLPADGSAKLETRNEADRSLVSIEPSEKKTSNPIQRATGRMMAVYEVAIDAEARNNDVLNLYLQKHGLGSVQDLALDEPQLSSVLKSGIVGPADVRGESQVFVLKGTASMLSEFYDDLVRSYQDFPSLRMNAVMDESVGVIESQLSSMQISDSAGAVARLGSSGPNGLVSNFSVGSSKFFDVPMEQRQLEKRREPGRDLNPVSYVILIVRAVK